jgi:hypothetical protein
VRRAAGLALVIFSIADTASAGQRFARVAIDLTRPGAQAPPRIHVDDGTRVVVHVAKSVFHSCTIATKVDALPAPANPVAQALAILGGLPGVPSALRADRPPAQQTHLLERQIDGLLNDVRDLHADLDDEIVQLRERALSLPRWVACDGTPLCSDAPAARAKLDRLAFAIQQTPSRPIASVAVASARAADLLKTLNAAVDRPTEDEGAWLDSAFERLRAIDELIDLAKERRDVALKGREALLLVRERILAYEPATVMEEPLAPQSNSKTLVTVACTNVVTQQPAVYRLEADDRVVADRLPPVSATVVYQTAPRATISGGVLYSTVDRRSIGIAPHRTGTDGRVATYERRVVENDRAAWQIVPFSFVNLIVPGLRGRAVVPAASLGIGLNPNNGSVAAEYFAGGSIAFGRSVTVQIGTHFGTRLEPAEQFAVGDVLPDRVTVVPTTRTRARGIGVGLTYVIPMR